MTIDRKLEVVDARFLNDLFFGFRDLASATLVKNEGGKYNIQIGTLSGQPLYFFPEMVSEEEARKAYGSEEHSIVRFKELNFHIQ